jgi:hypothetical protein
MKNEQYEFGWDPEEEKRSERIRKHLPNEEHLEAAILEGEEALRSAMFD